MDRTTPNYLVARYDMAYWPHYHLQLIKEVIGDHPEQEVLFSFPDIWRQYPLLNRTEKKNIALSGNIIDHGFYSDIPINQDYEFRIYSNALSTFKGRILGDGRNERIARAVLVGDTLTTVLPDAPIVRSVFDVYLDGDALVFVRDGYECIGNTPPMFVHIYPGDPEDLPIEVKQYGFENIGFFFWERGTSLDGLCVAISRPLPDWPIASIHLGQYRFRGESLWDVRFSLTRPDSDTLTLTGDPVARSVFDVYHDGDTLVYVRDECSADEADTAFGLHVYPVSPDDLPGERRQYGFENRDFTLWQRGGWWEGRCTAVASLPDYPIASIQTGQYDETGRLWWVEFALPDAE